MAETTIDKVYYRGKDITELTAPELVEAIKVLLYNYTQLHQTMNDVFRVAISTGRGT